MSSLISIFYDIDDFCNWFEPLHQQRLLQDDPRQRHRQGQLTLSEIMTMIVLVETVNDQLKTISQIEHSRHHRLTEFMVNLVGELIAYTYQPKKPSLGLRVEESGLPVVI